MTRFLVAGAGVSGRAAAVMLRSIGEDVTVADDRVDAGDVTTAEAKALIDDGRIDTVVTSPGWRPETPLLVHAQDAGLEVIGDVELCYRLDQAGQFGEPRTWLAVTGTNGKTTTTSMLAAIMQTHAAKAGQRAEAVGNIGTAVEDALTDVDRVDILVAELSSFQLHWSSSLVLESGVLLNLAEDHLDWHGSMEAYAADKAKVLRAHHPVANADDCMVVAEASRAEKPATWFTMSQPGEGDVGVVDGFIVENHDGSFIQLADTTTIEPAGPAGVYDALAAAAVARTQGVAPETISQALSTFTVAAHRGATVHRGKKAWVDNSKATNPHAAISALAGYDNGVIWVAGGQLKGASVDELIATNARRFTAVAILGHDRALVADAMSRLAPGVPVFVTESSDPVVAMDELVEFCSGADGETVLLAPAAASLDMYTGMSQRGDTFAAAARRFDPVNPADPAKEH